MTTTSTAEAMAILNATRSEMIAEGRRTAIGIAKNKGTVHSRDVWLDMMNRGKIDAGVGGYWLGAIFRRDAFEWTGVYHTYSDEERNIHERTIKVWTLRPGI